MKAESARALIWVTGILIVLGLVVMSPAGAFALVSLAAISAVVPTVFGPKAARIVAAALLIASLALAATFYSAFDKEREAYAQRAKQRAAKSSAVPAKIDETKK
jgi:uncharacterized PurR-regulated membrane protein YhhQ (DUF165 family)